MNITGVSTALPIILVLTTLFTLLRAVFDIQHYRLTHSRSHLASLLCFLAAWACFALSIGCALWKMHQMLETAPYGKQVTPYALLVGVTPQYWKRSAVLATVIPAYSVSTGLWLVKTSFFIMNFHLTRALSAGMSWMLWVLGAFLALSYVANIAFLSFWCRPLERQFALSHASCTTITSNIPAAVHFILNITSYVYTMAVPVLITRKLQLGAGDKWGLALLLFLGCCTMATMVVRNATLVRLGQMLPLGPAASAVAARTDALAGVAYVSGVLELAVALCAASLPAVRSKLHRERRGRTRGAAARKQAGEAEADEDGDEEELNVGV